MHAFAALLVLTSAPTPAAPSRTDDFQWHGPLAAGKTIEIIGVNGSIDASGASGREVEVTATKKGRRSDPASVEIKVVEHADGVTICAVYPPGRDGKANECLAGGKGRMNTDRNDVAVTWTVKVPPGVKLAARTVNGEIVARGLGAEVRAETVNGSIAIATASWAEATTVNGSITASLGRGDWSKGLEFETVNGSITLDLPDALNADVDAETVNGALSTDFPLTVKGRWGPRRMHGTLGQGGRSLNLSTVNGNVTLKRS
jgi:hypothetical protein